MARTSPLDDPSIDTLWIAAAAAAGFTVVRTRDAYASTDGRGNILIGERETLDADDSVAQLVLHELCHALVEGEAAWRVSDWGLDNTSERDRPREHAALRLQAHLADAFGLRALMLPTTISRAYYAALPQSPLEGDVDSACAPARAGSSRAAVQPFADALSHALAGTAALVARAAPPVPLHPLGFAPGPNGQSCGTCAWRYVGGRGTAVSRCRQSAGADGNGRRVRDEWGACERWEPPVDCLTCGACCREAYHVVSVRMRDPVVWKQPQMVERSGPHFNLRREGDRCAALNVQIEGADRRYGCAIYEDRPQTCRDFEQGGAHCLTARRRVGLSVST